MLTTESCSKRLYDWETKQLQHQQTSRGHRRIMADEEAVKAERIIFLVDLRSGMELIAYLFLPLEPIINISMQILIES